MKRLLVIFTYLILLAGCTVSVKNIYFKANKFAGWQESVVHGKMQGAKVYPSKDSARYTYNDDLCKLTVYTDYQIQTEFGLFFIPIMDSEVDALSRVNIQIVIEQEELEENACKISLEQSQVSINDSLVEFELKEVVNDVFTLTSAYSLISTNEISIKFGDVPTLRLLKTDGQSFTMAASL